MEISITADDDGSGTVALLEIAEAFQRLKKQVTDLNVRSCFYM
jgi:Zn-dependent M28 family amino/carboxypeptidase